MNFLKLVCLVIALVAVAKAMKPSEGPALWSEALDEAFELTSKHESRHERKYLQELEQEIEAELEADGLAARQTSPETRCIEITNVSIPDRVRPDETNFEVSITATNCGRARWSPNNMWMMFQGERSIPVTKFQLDVRPTVHPVKGVINKPVLPGESYTFYRSIDISPQPVSSPGFHLPPGFYHLSWRAATNSFKVNQTFGEFVNHTLEVTCSDGNYCNGEERWAGFDYNPASPNPFASFACVTSEINVCEDYRRCTVDQCLPNFGGVCSYGYTTENCDVCNAGVCVPDCAGRECGGDGCGGTCGACLYDSQVCDEGTCINREACPETDGTCDRPFSLFNDPEIPITQSVHAHTYTVTGNTANGISMQEPTCKRRPLDLVQVDPTNLFTKTKAPTPTNPELIYSFTLNRTMGIDARAIGHDGFDTLLELREGLCDQFPVRGNLTVTLPENAQNELNVIDCNDNSSPPGNFGSRVTGLLSPGTYYLIVEGAKLNQNVGEFTLQVTFRRNCVPQCDGRPCGSDGCGGTCGTCPDLFECKIDDVFGTAKCVRDMCDEGVTDCDFIQPDWPEFCPNGCTATNVNGQSYAQIPRECGADGCGGMCTSPTYPQGVCGSNEVCLGGLCVGFPVCDPQNPFKNPVPNHPTDGSLYYVGSDCEWHSLVARRPDLVGVPTNGVPDLGVEFTADSCEVERGCAVADGQEHDLFRFTTITINQGMADFRLPRPTMRPDLFVWSECEQQWLLRDFFRFTLTNSTGHEFSSTTVDANCVSDDVLQVVNPNTHCESRFGCNNQGLQKGWASLTASTDACNFVEVTDLPPDTYFVTVEVNSERYFHESTFDNNANVIGFTIS